MSKKMTVNTDMLLYEKQYWAEGFSKIIGIDEAGRGPLAGPVVVAGVVFRKDSEIPKVNDSKKLSERQRLELKEMIIKTPGVEYCIIVISENIIDEINILQATHRGMRETIKTVGEVDLALIDGLPVPRFPIKSIAIVKGDGKSASIAAASILAKTHRDRLMKEYAELYPEYGFEKHSGYGTKQHLEALKKYGPSPIHRKTFKPVRNIITPPPEQLELF
jgi:ribonuclease HII